MDTKVKNKATYSLALEMARTHTSTEKEALAAVQRQIDLGLVGDPNRSAKERAWKFADTDMTFYKDSARAEKSKALNPNNTRTPEIEKIESIIQTTNKIRYDYLRELHEQGAFGDVGNITSKIESQTKNTIMRFLNTNEM